MQENWHLSKSVPVTLIVGLLVQGAAIVWTVSAMSADITRHNEKIQINSTAIVQAENNIANLAKDLEAKNDQLGLLVQDQAITLARIEESLKNIYDRLNEIRGRRN